MGNSAFCFPPHLPETDQVKFCLSTLQKFHQEQDYLRKKLLGLINERNHATKEANYWKRKYQEIKEKCQKYKRENDKLVKDLEKLLVTKTRYEVALFDHGNFLGEKAKGLKSKGGQLSHPDTNRESYENRESFPKIRLFAKSCPKCGGDINQVDTVREKLLVDIVLNPKAVKLLAQSQRQWCLNCHQEVRAYHPQSLPFTEYGLNTFLAVILLRFGGNLSLGKISAVFPLAFGLPLSKGEIAHLLSQAKTYLKDKYESLKQAARNRDVTYHDETGWLVRGQGAWLWIMATPEGETIYVAAESRGKGIAKGTYGDSQSLGMHDGLASYQTVIAQKNQAYCWAHLLRFAFEETVRAKKRSDSVKIRNKLVTIYQFKKNHPNISLEKLQTFLETELTKIANFVSKETTGQKIINRVRKQKDGLIRALLLTPDGTNNLAERELRPLVISKQTSFGSDTFSGMETTAILGTVYRTTIRTSSLPLTQLREDFLTGVRKTHPQFLQIPIQDSS